MIKSICILGRQPALGMAELESLYGEDSLEQISEIVVGLNVEADNIDFNRLGGSLKVAKIIGQIENFRWPIIEKSLLEQINKLVPIRARSKLQFGVSVYGLEVNIKQLQAYGYKLKKTLRDYGQSVRLVPNQELALNSAQVLHNRLFGERGLELSLIKYGHATLIAQTIQVQNITSYTFRDRGRPKRDMRVGMLPPKLAQIMVNLAQPSKDQIVLDPFCGTGVILQEAALMGYQIYGTDVEPRMIDYTQSNLDWLKRNFSLDFSTKLEVGDATEEKWSKFDVVASEIYLGQPFSAYPSPDKLSSVINTCNKIAEGFLANLHAQLPNNCRVCIAIPAWNDPKTNRFSHLPLLDHIASLGYNRVSFSKASYRDLIYYRPGQIVARELVVITRK